MSNNVQPKIRKANNINKISVIVPDLLIIVNFYSILMEIILHSHLN